MTSPDLAPSVLSRAFAVLDALPGDGTGITLTDLARKVEIPKGSLHRLLGQFLSLEVVRREGDLYYLGRHLFDLTRFLAPDTRLRQAAMPHMVELYNRIGETLHLGVLADLEVLYVERLAKAESPRWPTRVGQRMPAYCTGLGKALLAFCRTDSAVERVVHAPMPRRTPHTLGMPGMFMQDLSRIRERGFAHDREEAMAGLTCVAMPVMGRSGPVAAISISTSTASSRAKTEHHLQMLSATATSISKALRQAEPFRPAV
jgi:IclR family acetate operon transcriptional repressor